MLNDLTTRFARIAVPGSLHNEAMHLSRRGASLPSRAGFENLVSEEVTWARS